MGMVAGATVAALLCFAPAANAAFGLTPTVTPSSNNAGANADFKIDIAITEPSHDLKDLTIHLPPGLVGNPLAAAQCSEEKLNSDSCPAESDVGDLSNDVTLNALGGLLPIPQTVTGDVYNVVPHSGEPARFGIVLRPLPVDIPPLTDIAVQKIILQSGAALRPSDLGLDSILTDLPNTATVGGTPTDIDINSLSLTLAGMAGTPPKGFIRLPTSCKTHTVGFDAKSYDDQVATGQTTFDTTNCASLPFTPEFSAQIAQDTIGEGVAVSTTISQTIDEAGLQRAQVTLPKDITGNTMALATQCTDADFQAGNCPANTIVGSASATSPLQSQPLSGPVALVDSPISNFPDLGIDLRGPLALKLKGVIALTDDIRSQVTFDGLPDIPIADFTLTFAGGPRATALNFAVRDLCQPPPLVFDASFLSHSGATASVSPEAAVTCSGAGGGGAGGGGGGHARKPRAKIKVAKESSDEPTLNLRIKKGSEKLKSAVVKLPKQLRFSSKGKIKITHTKRTLKLKSKKAVKKLAAKFGGGAVKPGKGLSPRAKLDFKLKVRDAKGKTTKLKVRAK
jgi:hypothetical protein